MTKIQSLKMVPNPIRFLFRPILFVALGIHALLLFAPLPSEQKNKEPDDKKDPIKIVQIPTAKPAEAKVPATVKVAAKSTNKSNTKSSLPPARPTVSSTASAFTPSSSSIPSSSSSIPSSSASSSQSTSSTSLPPSPSTSSASETAPSQRAAKPFSGNPVKALYEILVNLPTADSKNSGSSDKPNPVSFDEINQPNLLFKPQNNEAKGPEKLLPERLPGLEETPLLAYFPLEQNLNLESFYESVLKPKLNTVFEDASVVGDYGDGPLYKLKAGSSTVYLSLMPPKSALGAIMSVWSKDPRSNQKAN
jgi:hypothetical protein